MDKFERADVIDMFDIMTGHLNWDQLGAKSYYELQDIKNKMASEKDLTADELQAAYNIIQNARFYFNSHVDDPRFPASFKMDAARFGVYYMAFLAMYPVKNLQTPKNQYGGCYIATAVYGSYFDPKVMTLRLFRDKYLSKYAIGRKFIDFYYKYSPCLAIKLEEAKYINRIVRKLLDLFVFVIKTLEK